MVEFIFEGEVSALCEIQQEFVKNVLKELGINDGKVEIETVGKPGDNYAANVKRIVTKKEDKVFKMIAKIAPTQEQIRQNLNTAVCFLNENNMYCEVLPKFTQLENNANIAIKERLKYAKFYGSYMEEPHEIILLEDLTVSDYIVLDRFTSLKDDSIKLVLNNFAKLHAASYALKNFEPETFECFSKKLFNIWELFANVPSMNQTLKDIVTGVVNLMDEEKYLKIVNEIMSDTFKEAVAMSKSDRGNNFSIINQGDPWTNNILFKLEGEKSIDCCMIDYQLSKRGSPVADITCLIFVCTDFDTRSKYFHDWMNYYHSELEKYLNHYGLKTDSTYPRHQLEKDLKSYARFSLGQSMVITSLLIRESKDAAKFKEAVDNNMPIEEIMQTINVNLLDETTLKKLKNKVVGLIDSFFELGYLQE